MYEFLHHATAAASATGQFGGGSFGAGAMTSLGIGVEVGETLQGAAAATGGAMALSGPLTAQSTQIALDTMQGGFSKIEENFNGNAAGDMAANSAGAAAFNNNPNNWNAILNDLWQQAKAKCCKQGKR